MTTLAYISLFWWVWTAELQNAPAAESQPAPATRPAATQPARPPMTQRRPQQAQIYEQLLQRESLRPVVPGRGGADITETAATRTAPLVGVQLEGQTIHNRRVRLARNGERVELIFRSEDGGPLTLIALENQLLEVMERETETGAREFIISGELTTYRGRNYVRILKVLRPLDNGNLTP